MLDFLSLGHVEGERVDGAVWSLVAAGDQFVVVEELGGEVDDGRVGAVVLAQHHLAGAVRGVVLVQALQERRVEALLSGEVRVQFGAQLSTNKQMDL